MIKISYDGLTLDCVKGIFKTVREHFQDIKIRQYITGRFSFLGINGYHLEFEIARTDSGEIEREIISVINKGFMEFYEGRH